MLHQPTLWPVVLLNVRTEDRSRECVCVWRAKPDCFGFCTRSLSITCASCVCTDQCSEELMGKLSLLLSNQKKNNNKSYELDTCCVELSFLFATHNGSVSPLSNAVYSICPPPILSSDVRHSPSRLAVTASSFKPSCEYAAVYDCALRGMSNGDVTVSWLALWFNSMSCIYFCLLRLYFYGYIWFFFFIYLCYPMHRILNMQLFNVTYRTNDML